MPVLMIFKSQLIAAYMPVRYFSNAVTRSSKLHSAFTLDIRVIRAFLIFRLITTSLK